MKKPREIMRMIWKAMIYRCTSPKSAAWVNYGGRGIRVCDRWFSFEAFVEDVGYRPSPKLQLDRINNEGDYEPGNCRWVTASTNSRNRRDGNIGRLRRARAEGFETWRDYVAWKTKQRQSSGGDS